MYVRSFLGNPEDYTDALVDNIVNYPPGCNINVKRCQPRSCRTATGSTVTCTDDMVVGAVTETNVVECLGVNIPVTFVTECSCSCTAPTVSINGKVIGSDTSAPLEGINATLSGQTDNYLTDANGEFSFSVSSSVRRLILKTSDLSNNYNDAFLVSDILVGYTDPIFVTIVMVRKAPYIQIDPTQENELAISGSPSDQGTGVASINIPANAFFTIDGTPFTGDVFVSLTYLDPLDPDILAMMPGRFVTLDANGEETIIITKGVFSLSSEDIAGNELIINGEIDVSGSQGYSLWEFEPVTETWIEIDVNPVRKRRQITQQQYLGSFNPQSASWFNIDRILSEPDCFFKVRVFQDSFAPLNEIISGTSFVPEVSQVLATGTEVVKYYSYPRSSPCISIKCPSAIAQATIRIRGLETVYGVSGLEVSVLPANILEYSTALRSVLEATPYFYSVLQNDTSTLFINTPLNESGPFYLTEETCLNSTATDAAFWFIKDTTFVEDDFDDGFDGRCVTKIEIAHIETQMLNTSVFSMNNLTSVSTWGDNKYSIRTAEMNFVRNDSIWVYFESCIEYRCSRANGTSNDTTRVILGVSNVTECSFSMGGQCKRYADPYGANFIAPILDATDLQYGFFFTNTTNAQSAISDCLASTSNYTDTLYCGSVGDC